jgi:phosphoketolase
MIRVLSKESKDNRLAQINSYWRAANYLGAIQLYLQDNAKLLVLSGSPTVLQNP